MLKGPDLAKVKEVGAYDGAEYTYYITGDRVITWISATKWRDSGGLAAASWTTAPHLPLPSAARSGKRKGRERWQGLPLDTLLNLAPWIVDHARVMQGESSEKVDTTASSQKYTTERDATDADRSEMWHKMNGDMARSGHQTLACVPQCSCSRS